MTIDQGDTRQVASAFFGQMRLFIAAPDEVREERELIARVIQEHNERAGDGYGISLYLIETSRAAGAAAQELSSGDWDVFVGVVWLRFGTSVDPRDPDPRHINDPGTEDEFIAACQVTETSGEPWPKAMICRRTQPPIDLLSFDVAEYLRVQEFFAGHNSITSPKLLVKQYIHSGDVEEAFRDQLSSWVAEFAGRQAVILTEKGQAAQDDARWEEATAYYEQAADLFKQLGQADSERAAGERAARAQRGSKQDHAREYEEQGDKFRSDRAWGEAQKTYLSSLELARDLEDGVHQGQLLHKMGLVAAEQELWQDALDYYGQAKQYLDKMEQPAQVQKITADQVVALEELALSRHEAKDWERATTYYSQALGLAAALTDRPKAASLHLQLGLVAEEKGEWPGALDEYDHALELLSGPDQLDQKLDVMRRQLVALEKVGELARQEQNVYRAEAYYRDGVAVARSLSDSDKEGEFLTKLGEIAEERGQWRQALGLEREALIAFEQTDNADRYSAVNAHLASVMERVGDAEREQQRWEAARSAYRESLSITHDIEDRGGEGELLYKLGLLAEAQGQWNDALDYLKQALPLFQGLGVPEREADVLNHQLKVITKVGDAARAAKNLAHALSSYHQALAWAQHLGDKSAEAQLWWKLGLLSAEQEQWLQAVGYYGESLDRLKGTTSESARPDIVADQSFALEKLGDESTKERNWERAESSYQQALQLGQEVRTRRPQASLLNKLGMVSEGKEEWPEALARYRSALSSAREAGITEIEPTVNENVRRADLGVKRLRAVEALEEGDAARSGKNWDQAEAAYLESLALAEELQNRAQEAELLHRLGQLSEDRAQWVDALTYYRKALPILTEQGERDAQVKVIWNIGRTQRRAQHSAAIEALEQGDAARAGGRWEEADSAYHRSLALSTQLGDKTAEAEILHRLGQSAAAQENWQKGLDYYEQALSRLDVEKDTDKQLAVRRDQALAVSRLGDEMRAAKNWEQARSSYQFSLEFARTVGDQQGQGLLLNQLGVLAADQEQWQEAIRYYKDAFGQLGAPESEPARIQVLRNEAAAFEQIGDTALDAEDWTGAESAYRESIALAKDLDDTPVQGQLFDKLGLAAETQGQWDVAIDQYQQALGCFQKSGLKEAQDVVSENIQRSRSSKLRQLAAEAEAKGEAYFEAKHWDEAANQYQEAHDLYAQIGMTDEQANAAMRVERARHAKSSQQMAEQAEVDGNAAAEARQWDAAANQFKHAHDLFAVVGLSERQAEMAVQLEQTHRSRLKEAAENFQKQGESAFKAKQWDQATEEFRQAFELFAQIGLADDQAKMSDRIDEAVRGKVLEAAENAQAAGDASLLDKEWDRAIEHFRLANDLFAELEMAERQSGAAKQIEQAQRGKLHEAAENFQRQGAAASDAREWDQAAAHYKQALDLYAQLGSADEQTGMAAKIKEARRSKLQEAAEAAEAGGESAFAAKQWDEAVIGFNQALGHFAELGLNNQQTAMAVRIQQAKNGKDQQEAAKQAAAEGERALAARDWDNAEACFERANEIFAELELAELQADATDRLAHARHARQLEAAETAAKEGHAASAQFQWDEAVEHYRQAQSIYADMGLEQEHEEMAARIEHTHRSKLLESAEQAEAFGNAALQIKRWDEALEHFQRARDYFSDLGLGDKQANMAAEMEHAQRSKVNEAAERLEELGEEAFESKQWDAAADQFQQALDLYAQIGPADRQARMASRIEEAHRTKLLEAAETANANGNRAVEYKEWDEAVEHYQQALDLFADLGLTERKEEIGARILQARRGERQDEGGEAAAEGEEALALKDWDAAEASFQRAADIFQELELNDLLSTASDRIAETRRSRQIEAAEVASREGQDAFRKFRWPEAIEHYQHAQRVYADLAMPEAVAIIDERIAQIRRAERAARLEFAEQTAARGDAALESKDWAKAEECYEQAAHLYSELDLAQSVARVSAQVGHLRREQKGEAAREAAARGDQAREAQKYHEAEDAYMTSLALVRELENPQAEGSLLEALGGVAESQGEWDRAQDYYQRALDIFHNLDVSTGQMVIWKRLGGVFYTRQDWVAASESYQHSLAISREFGERAFEAQVLDDLGLLARAQEHWDEALQHYQQALNLFTKLGISDAQELVRQSIDVTQRAKKKEDAISATARADAALAQENWREALEDYHKAHSLFAELGEPAEAEVLKQIELAEQGHKRQQAVDSVKRGEIAVRNNRPEEAEAAYEKSAELWRELAERERAAESLAKLGDLAELQGHWEDAQDRYFQAQTLYAELQMADVQAEMAAKVENAKLELKKLGAQQAAERGAEARSAGDWARAESAYGESLRLTVELGDPLGQANVHYALGEIAEAQEHWQQAAEAYHRIYSIYQQADDTENQTAALEKAGDAHKRGREWLQAREAYQEALGFAIAHQDRKREAELLNKLGTLDAAEGHWEDAEGYYKKALKIFKELELHSAQTNVWMNIAQTERGAKSTEALEAARFGDEKRRAKQWRAAEDAYRHSMILSMEVGEHESEAWRWNDLGLLAADQEDWSSAEDNYKRALDILQQLDSREALTKVWRNIAAARQAAKQWAAAENAYGQSMALAEAAGDRAAQAWLWNDLGLLASGQQDWSTAQERYQHALDMFRETGSPEASTEVRRNLLLAQAGSYRQGLAEAQQQGSHSRQGQILNDLGLIAERLGRWSEALDYYDQALRLFEGIDFKDAQVTIWRNIGDAHRVRRRWADAEAAYRQSLSLAQRLGFRNSEAESLGLLGLVAEGREEWPEALAMHQAALAIFESLGDKKSQSAALGKIGDAERGAQHWAEAEEAYRKGLQTARELVDASREGHALNKLGMLAADRELWEEAKELYRQALADFESADSPLDQAQTLSNIGKAELGARAWMEASEAYLAALSLYREIGDESATAWATVDLARLHVAQSLWPEATKFLQDAREAFQKLNQPIEEGLVLKEMARVRMEVGALGDADQLARSSLAISVEEGDKLLQSETHRFLAAIRFEREEMNEAQEELERAIEANPRNVAAQIDLGVALLFPGAAGDAIRQFNACMDRGPLWELKARTGLTLALYLINDNQGFQGEIEKVRSLIAETETAHSAQRVTRNAAQCIIAGLESKDDEALARLEGLMGEPPLPEERDAYRFARLSLLLVSRSPLRVKSTGGLADYFKKSISVQASSSSVQNEGATLIESSTADLATADASTAKEASPARDEVSGRETMEDRTSATNRKPTSDLSDET